MKQGSALIFATLVVVLLIGVTYAQNVFGGYNPHHYDTPTSDYHNPNSGYNNPYSGYNHPYSGYHNNPYSHHWNNPNYNNPNYNYNNWGHASRDRWGGGIGPIRRALRARDNFIVSDTNIPRY